MGTEEAHGPVWGPGSLPGEGGELADSQGTHVSMKVCVRGCRPGSQHRQGKVGTDI